MQQFIQIVASLFMFALFLFFYALLTIENANIIYIFLRFAVCDII